MVKNFFQKCNPPDFRFYLSKLTNKNSPIPCSVNFGFVFSAIFVLFVAVKRDSK